jgi:hypothetical protein
VALDYHNVIQFNEWTQNSKGDWICEEVIYRQNITAIQRLAQHHEVYIYSWAPSRGTSQAVENLLFRSGILDTIGGSRHLHTGRAIEAKVSFFDEELGRWKVGKAKLCQINGIHVLVDDSHAIAEEARNIGLPCIQVHPRFGVRDLTQAVDLILDNPERYFSN